MPDASINVPSNPVCVNAPNMILVPATPFGIFSGTGIVDVNTGEFSAGIAGLGTHRIHYQVTDPNGCFNNDSIDIVVIDVPTADAGADMSMCAGDQVQIGGSPTGTAGTSTPILVSYIWNPAGGLSSSVDPNPFASPSATTMYEVMVTDANGCAASDDVWVTVNPNPVVDAGGSAGICTGGSTIIGGTPTASAGTPPFTYSWAPASGLSSTTVSNPSASPALATIYTVTVTDANGCVGSDMIIVTISADPTAHAGQTRRSPARSHSGHERYR